VQLVLDVGDAAAALAHWPEHSIDAWFFDGFSPAKNPEMWSEPVLRAAARASRPGATFATYTSAGWVRRGLRRAGFEVRRVPGFGRKREMLVGRRDTPSAAPG
jgi:tRNA 5-methylaminomethyl-2-thiouridine biosynthesis bifunctional protein